jgi:ABC-type branched-subunit amino acid transport system ATPase component
VNLLVIDRVTKHFGGVVAVRDLTLQVRVGEIVAIIGPNGAGKTTLFNLISGFARPDAGDMLLRGASLVGLPPHTIFHLGVARTFQELRLIHGLTVLDHVLLSWRTPHDLGPPNSFRNAASARRDGALSALAELGLDSFARSSTRDLSYGQQKLLSFAVCLAAHAGVILLDEPIAGLSPLLAERVLSVIQERAKQGTAALVVEHHLEQLIPISDRLVVMQSGVKLADGTPGAVTKDPVVLNAYLH